MERTPDPVRQDLRRRADRVAAELERVTTSWNDGAAPSAAELYALVDELAEIRELLARLGPRTDDSAAEPLSG